MNVSGTAFAGMNFDNVGGTIDLHAAGWSR